VVLKLAASSVTFKLASAHTRVQRTVRGSDYPLGWGRASINQERKLGEIRAAELNHYMNMVGCDPISAFKSEV
jgi:hypothetical protein